MRMRYRGFMLSAEAEPLGIRARALGMGFCWSCGGMQTKFGAIAVAKDWVDMMYEDAAEKAWESLEVSGIVTLKG